jgi:hypothetical protein
MASPVVVLEKITPVREVLKALTSTHNGFPIVELPPDDKADHSGEPCHAFLTWAWRSVHLPLIGHGVLPRTFPRVAGELCHGLILRRQLMALLNERVWERQHLQDLSEKACKPFLTSFSNLSKIEAQGDVKRLSSADLDAMLDLRPRVTRSNRAAPCVASAPSRRVPLQVHGRGAVHRQHADAAAARLPPLQRDRRAARARAQRAAAAGRGDHTQGAGTAALASDWPLLCARPCAAAITLRPPLLHRT